MCPPLAGPPPLSHMHYSGFFLIKNHILLSLFILEQSDSKKSNWGQLNTIVSRADFFFFGNCRKLATRSPAILFCHCLTFWIVQWLVWQWMKTVHDWLRTVRDSFAWLRPCNAHIYTSYFSVWRNILRAFEKVLFNSKPGSLCLIPCM